MAKCREIMIKEGSDILPRSCEVHGFICPKPLSFKKLLDSATTPTKANSNDAGFDLYSTRDLEIPPGCRGKVSTGIAMEIPDGYVGLIWPRSGLAVKQGVDVFAGVIDSGYRGEIIVCLYNAGSSNVVIKRGDKIAQILIQEVPQFQMVEVETLSDSDRGEKGFGSSDQT